MDAEACQQAGQLPCKQSQHLSNKFLTLFAVYANTERVTLQEIYAAIPKIECKKLCAAYCGPVPFTPEERKRMIRVFGSMPKLSDGLSCGALCSISGTCNAYEARPFICRLWGVVPRLECPHGCKPERYLSTSEERKLMQAYNSLRPEIQDFTFQLMSIQNT